MKPLHIATPCHAAWDAMTPASGGRHCSTCDKTVIDLTALEPAAARAALTDELPRRLAAGEHLCVRAHADRQGQLRPASRTTRRRLTNGTALILAAAISGGVMAAEDEPILMGKMAAPVMGSAAPIDPLAPVTDVASGLTARLDWPARAVIACDATGAERWRVSLAHLQQAPTSLKLADQVVTVELPADPQAPAWKRSLAIDIRTGGVYDR